MFLGAIADDVTGGTDLASVLRRGGLRVVQTLDTLEIPPRADAVVMSMKTRTIRPRDISQSTSSYPIGGSVDASNSPSFPFILGASFALDQKKMSCAQPIRY